MIRCTLTIVLLLIGFTDVRAQEGDSLEAVAKSARRAQVAISVRNRQMKTTARKGGPNFSGRWAGRYVFVPSASNCSSPLGSFLFRHILSQSSRWISLNTSHDGSFGGGQSRDKGRRVEFSKAEPSRRGTVYVAVVYKNLSNSQRVSGTGYAVKIPATGCIVAFGANAIKQ